MAKREPPPLATYDVTDVHNNKHEIEAHYVFNTEGELVLRYKTSTASYVVACFARGQWTSCIKRRA